MGCGYKVYSSDNASFVPDANTLIGETSTETGYADIDLPEGTALYYKVSAVDGAGNESFPFSVVDATTAHSTPDAPSFLSIADNGSGTLQFTWRDNSVNETAFSLQESIDGGSNYKTVATTTATNLTLPRPPSTGGMKYRVLATNAAGPSAAALPVAPPSTSGTTSQPTTSTQDGSAPIVLAFYGAGPAGGFGNTWFAEYVWRRFGRDTKIYGDWGKEGAIRDALSQMDTNNNQRIETNEIRSVYIYGYSWGGTEAIRCSRDLSFARNHAGRPIARLPLTPDPGYGLDAPIPVAELFTMDPVKILKPTDGPKSNVHEFTNYFQQNGGTTEMEIRRYGMPNAPYESITFGNWFSAKLKGSLVGQSEASLALLHQIEVSPIPASGLVIAAQPILGPIRNGTRYGFLDGTTVNHDTLPWMVAHLGSITLQSLA